MSEPYPTIAMVTITKVCTSFILKQLKQKFINSKVKMCVVDTHQHVPVVFLWREGRGPSQRKTDPSESVSAN